MWNISIAFSKFINSEVICGGLSDKTREAYQRTRDLVVGFYGNRRLRTLRLDDVQAFYLGLRETQATNTARGHLIQFRAVLRFAERRGQVSFPVDEIKVPRRQKTEVLCLDEGQVRKFIEGVAEPRRGYSRLNRLRNIAMAEVLWSSGIRVGELCRLNRGSIKNREFVVVGKSKHPRTCFISVKAERAIGDYLRERKDLSPALFIANQTGERIRPTGVRRVFRRVGEQIGAQGVHPHTFRHSFATNMLAHEVDLRYIGEMLGHESLDTTKIYTHYTNPELRKIYEKVQKKC